MSNRSRSTLAQTGSFDGPMRTAWIVGAVAAVIAVVGLFVSGPGLFFQAYLYAYLFWLGISLGGMGLLMLHWSVSTTWGMTIRRVVEANTSSLWLMAVLFIPLIFGLPYLFIWARPAEVAASPILQEKTWWLNTPFFVIRAVIYFAIWIGLGWVINRRSAQLATLPLDQSRTRLQGLAAFGLVVYAFTMTAASVDWLMSLEPEWVSTAFGMIIVLGQVLTAMSFALLMLNLFPSLSLGRRWTAENTPVPYQELGALLMTMVMAFTYVAFFQMLIIWAGNIPRETIWFVHRVTGGWSYVIDFVALFQFVVPFAVLLAGRVRHNLRLLAMLGAVLLFTNLVNMFWHIKPVFSPGAISLSWLDIVLPIAIGGIWFGVFLYHLKRRPALTSTEQATLSLSGQGNPVSTH